MSNGFGRLPGYDSVSAEEAMQNRNPGSLSRHKGGPGAALPVVGVKSLAPVERVEAARAVPLLVHTAVCMACPSLHTLIPLHRAAFTKTLCLNGQHERHLRLHFQGALFCTHLLACMRMYTAARWHKQAIELEQELHFRGQSAGVLPSIVRQGICRW